MGLEHWVWVRVRGLRWALGHPGFAILKPNLKARRKKIEISDIISNETGNKMKEIERKIKEK